MKPLTQTQRNILKVTGVVLSGVALGILSATILECQTLPSAPTKVSWMTRTEAMDASGFLFTRSMDPISTWRALSHGGVEENLPRSFVTDKPAFMAYSLGIAGGEILLEHKLDRTKLYHDHKWFRMTERAAIETTVGMMARQDMHNWGCHKVNK